MRTGFVGTRYPYTTRLTVSVHKEDHVRSRTTDFTPTPWGPVDTP